MGIILTFATIHEALTAEKAVGKAGEMLVPLPPGSRATAATDY